MSPEATPQALAYRHLRRDQHLRRQQLADELGVHDSMVAQFENGYVPVPETLRDGLDGALALGRRGRHRRPRYILAVISKDARTRALAADDMRVGVFTRRGVADTAAGLLRQFGLAGAAPLPVWPAFFEGYEADVIDAGPDAEVLERVTQYVMHFYRAITRAQEASDA